MIPVEVIQAPWHASRFWDWVAARVSDKRVLKLIRAFLNAGVMEDGLVRPVDEGTPQGGPITPRTQKAISASIE
jgi:hypothetical protein